MEDHRSSDFPGLAAPLFQDLKKIFKTTTGQPFIFPASGTGAWEASLSNTLSPGDKVLAARFGMFSHLWIDMAQRLGLEVEILETEWGEGAPIERYRDALAADKGHKIKAVLFTHNETATGVTSRIPLVRAALDRAGHPALLMVDTISSLGSIDYRHDEWGVDVSVSGSQKGLMLPPGLSFNAVGPRALEATKSARLPRAYWDWNEMIAANANGFFPSTPATNLLYGLHEAIAMLEEEGLPNVFARHQRLAEATRAAVRAWELEILCADPAE
jgi:alanine-glyoxylate transaminase/serine-glyoxylate transaminase/serine-pyruvate transaminase